MAVPKTAALPLGDAPICEIDDLVLFGRFFNRFRAVILSGDDNRTANREPIPDKESVTGSDERGEISQSLSAVYQFGSIESREPHGLHFGNGMIHISCGFAARFSNDFCRNSCNSRARSDIP